MSRAVKQPQIVDYEPYYEMLQDSTDEVYEIANRVLEYNIKEILECD